jgi:hypothetical protein
MKNWWRGCARHTIAPDKLLRNPETGWCGFEIASLLLGIWVTFFP